MPGIVHLLPNGQQQFCDGDGKPYAAGKVYHYVPGTTTPSTTWVDQGLSTPNTNPITLDAAGRATIWGNTSYRQLLTDSLGNEVWDQITGDANYNNLVLTNPTITGGTISGATITGGTVTASVGPSLVLADGPNPNPLPSNPTQGTRTVAQFVGSFVDARNFLGLSNAALRATSDDSSVIQAAINYAQSIGGATVYLGPGPLNIPAGSSVNWPFTATGVSLKGDGPYSTIITVSGNLTTDVFALTAGNPAHCQIRDLGFSCVGIGGGGALIHFVNNYSAHVENVRMSGGFFNGVAVGGGANQYLTTIRDLICPNGVNACIILGDDTNGLVQGTYIDTCKLAASAFGIYMRNVSGVEISATETLNHTDSGLITAPAVGEKVSALQCTGFISDTCGLSGINLGSSGGTIALFTFVNCYSSSCQNGVIITASPAADTISFTGCQFHTNQQSGVLNLGANGVIVANCLLDGNGTLSANTYDAISMQNAINCVITGNLITSPRQRYAISINGSQDYTTVVGNTTGGPSGTASIGNLASGTHNVVANNTGT